MVKCETSLGGSLICGPAGEYRECKEQPGKALKRKGYGMVNMEHEAIIGETRAFAEAWNRADAKAAAEFYTEDGVRVGAFGDIQTGRREIEAAYDRLLHQVMPGANVSQEEGSVRMLTPEYAIWQGGMEIMPADGRATIKGYVVQVMKR